ncbi:hypothetical protein F2P79_007638 [Pimephales promelas]|nr:hypothetical protein F2P79_007638 [Pimephales promelas]
MARLLCSRANNASEKHRSASPLQSHIKARLRAPLLIIAHLLFPTSNPSGGGERNGAERGNRPPDNAGIKGEPRVDPLRLQYTYILDALEASNVSKRGVNESAAVLAMNKRWRVRRRSSD